MIRNQLSLKPSLQATAGRTPSECLDLSTMFTEYLANFQGTPPALSSYTPPNADDPRNSRIIRGRIEERKMKEATDVLRKILIIVLALFVFFVVLPFVLKAVGFAVGLLIWLAINLIYLAVIIAVAYLILVCIRAVLR